MSDQLEDPYAPLLQDAPALAQGDTDSSSSPYGTLDSEFHQKFGRPLRFTGKDTPIHVKLHGAGKARDIGARDMTGDEVRFVVQRSKELGLNSRFFPKAMTTSTGVKITGPHVHTDVDGKGSNPYAALLSGQSAPAPDASSDADPYASLLSSGGTKLPKAAPQMKAPLDRSQPPVSGIIPDPGEATHPNRLVDGIDTITGKPQDNGKSDKWNQEQADMAARATAAGLPPTTDSRKRLTDAINRVEQAGFKTPHFIGTKDEPSGDRGVSRDVENLVTSLKAQEAATPAGPKRNAISKQRAFWEQEQSEGMTAQEWKSQTGDEEPLYPGERKPVGDPLELTAVRRSPDVPTSEDLQKRRLHLSFMALHQAEIPVDLPGYKESVDSYNEDVRRFNEAQRNQPHPDAVGGTPLNPHSTATHAVETPIPSGSSRPAGVEINLTDFIHSGTTPTAEDIGKRSYEGLGFTEEEASQFAKRLLGKTTVTLSEVAGVFYQPGSANSSQELVNRAGLDTGGRVILPDLDTHASDTKRAWLQAYRGERLSEETHTQRTDTIHALQGMETEKRNEYLGLFALQQKEAGTPLTDEEKRNLGVVVTPGFSGDPAELIDHLTDPIGTMRKYLTDVGSVVRGAGTDFVAPIVKGVGRAIHSEPLQAFGKFIEKTASEREALLGRGGMLGKIEQKAGGILPMLATGSIGALSTMTGISSYGKGESAGRSALDGALTYIGLKAAGAVAAAMPKTNLGVFQTLTDEEIKGIDEAVSSGQMSVNDAAAAVQTESASRISDAAKLFSPDKAATGLSAEQIQYLQAEIASGRLSAGKAQEIVDAVIESQIGAAQAVKGIPEVAQGKIKKAFDALIRAGIYTVVPAGVNTVGGRPVTPEGLAEQALIAIVGEGAGLVGGAKEGKPSESEKPLIEEMGRKPLEPETNPNKLLGPGEEPPTVIDLPPPPEPKGPRPPAAGPEVPQGPTWLEQMANENDAKIKAKVDEAKKAKADEAEAERKKIVDQALESQPKLTPEQIRQAAKKDYDAANKPKPTSDEIIDDAAHGAATSPKNDLAPPTKDQEIAGNYQKGHFKIEAGGLDISIENPQGSTRSGVDPETGQGWSQELKSHYGYIKRTVGADGEQVDAFVKEETPKSYNGPVFVVNQNKADGSFDEHKVMIGFPTPKEALHGYSENYAADQSRPGSMAEFSSPEEFKSWLKTADLSKPATTPTTGAFSAPSTDDAEKRRQEFEARPHLMAALRNAVRLGGSEVPKGHAEQTLTVVLRKIAAAATEDDFRGVVATYFPDAHLPIHDYLHAYWVTERSKQTTQGEVVSEEPPQVTGTAGIVKRLKENERRAERTAATDEQTGLASKNEWVRARASVDRDPETEVAVLDINDLKKFNDGFSHDVGDAYIQHVAGAIREAAKAAGIGDRRIFRTGGDEMVIAAPKGKAAEIVAAVKAKVAEFEHGGITGSVAAGVGENTKLADKAMYQDKAAMKVGAVKAGETNGKTHEVPGSTGSGRVPVSTTGSISGPETEAHIEATAKRLGNIHPMAVRKFYDAFHEARRTVIEGEKASQIKMLRGLAEIVRPNNKNLRKLFTDETGVKLPNSEKDTLRALLDWAKDNVPMVVRQEAGNVKLPKVKGTLPEKEKEAESQTSESPAAGNLPSVGGEGEQTQAQKNRQKGLEAIAREKAKRALKNAPKVTAHETRMMGIPVSLSSSENIGGVEHALYKSETGEGVIRVMDTDSGEVVTLKKYPKFDRAKMEYDIAVRVARSDVNPPKVTIKKAKIVPTEGGVKAIPIEQSFKVSMPDGSSNSQRWATEKEADVAARELESRWSGMPSGWKVVPSDEPVNYRWDDAAYKGVPIEEKPAAVAPPTKAKQPRVTKSPKEESPAEKRKREVAEAKKLISELGPMAHTPAGWVIAGTSLPATEETETALFTWDANGHYIAANPAGQRALSDLLSGKYKKSIGGITFTRLQAIRHSSQARIKARRMKPGLQRENLESLAAVLSAASDSKEEFAVGLPKSREHELTHVAQLAIRRFFNKDIDESEMRKLPHFAKISRGLEIKGYHLEEGALFIGHEAAAHIWGGQYDELRITGDEALDYMEGYYRLIAKTYGKDALKRFTHEKEAYRRFRNEVLEKVTEEEARTSTRTGRIQGSRAGSVRLPERRQGGTQAGTREKPEGGEGPLADIAWHGSPYRFDKFTLEHIGAGEGAQAYGWGLYFSGKEEVARYYKDNLSKQRTITADVVAALEWFDNLGFDTPWEALSAIRSHSDWQQRWDVSGSDSALKTITDYLSRPAQEGGLYKVDLKPAEDEYLLWDLPLSAQSEKVKEALRTAELVGSKGADETVDRWLQFGRTLGDNAPGSDFYHSLGFVAGQGITPLPGMQRMFEEGTLRLPADPEEIASKYLLSLGIKGIKFRNGVTRSKASLPGYAIKFNGNTSEWDIYDTKTMEVEGSFPERETAQAWIDWSKEEDRTDHNYVIFSDADIAIESVFADLNDAYAAMPLPDRLKELLSSITRSFLEEGKDDFDELIGEFSELLGEQFDAVADYLPDIIERESLALEQEQVPEKPKTKAQLAEEENEALQTKPGFAYRQHREPTAAESADALNPKDFKPGDHVTDIYTLDPYEVIVADVKGMAKFKDLETGYVQDFNAYNNKHFLPAERLKGVTIDGTAPAAETDREGLKPGTRKLMRAIQSALLNGEHFDNRKLTAMADEAFGGSRAAGTYDVQDSTDALEAAVNDVLTTVRDGGSIAFRAMKDPDPKARLADLRKLMAQLPRQADRTTEQIEFQQFSTPPTEAFVAARALAPTPDDIVLEPSAGNGSLATWAAAAGAKVHVNEISPRRRALLEEQGFDPTGVDAQFLNDLLPKHIQPTAILMNPPFSSTGGRTKHNKTIYGAEHVSDALKRLAPNGRLVAIVGQSMTLAARENTSGSRGAVTGATMLPWWKGILARYNVRANISVPGEEYAKYGTTFGNQILVIDKTGPTPGATLQEQLANVVRVQPENLEGVLDALEPIINDRPQISSADVGETGTDLRGDTGKPGGKGDTSGGDKLRGPGNKSRPPSKSPRSGGAKKGGAPVPSNEPGDKASQAGKTPQVDDSESFDPNVRQQLKDAGITPQRQSVKRVAEKGGTFVEYKPAKFTGGVVHPGNIVESTSMASVDPPDITYVPQLDPRIIKSGELSDLQYESVIYAGQRHEQRLPDGSRAAFYEGAGTGVGKGRVLAGIGLDNWNQKRRRILWLSVNNDLVPSTRRDFSNLLGIDPLDEDAYNKAAAEGKAPPIAVINDFSARNESIEFGDGILFSSYASLIKSANNGQSRFDQIAKWLGDDGILMFDEAHKAKNAVTTGQKQSSQTGAALMNLQQGDKSNPNWRIVFASATGATDVDNMGYMVRLGLWGDGTSFPGGFPEFRAAIGTGGVGAMEMVSRDMKAMGMYRSVMLSFKGVDYKETTHFLTPTQEDLYGIAARMWQLVLENFEEALVITHAGPQAKMHARRRFWNDQQRFFRQFLTALKVPTAIKEIETALAAGKSAVLGLYGTGEARTKDQVKKALASGGDLDDLDFSPKEILRVLVDRAFPTQRYTEAADPNDPTKIILVPVTDEEGRPIESAEAVAMKNEMLAEVDKLSLPDNPLDQIINYFGPDKVAEITGRKKRLQVNPETGKTEYVKRVEGASMEKASQHEMDNFQEGRKRIAIISASASTGISLHADNTRGNKQRRVHITLETGWSADIQMQTFGRTHRSNQAIPPEYVLLATNVGGEKRFLATIAARLASLGALTKGERKATGVSAEGEEGLEKYDFLNTYGEATVMSITAQVSRNSGPIADSLDIWRRMGLVKETVSGVTVVEPDVERFLNRILALEISEQNQMFEWFGNTFARIVAQAKSDGTFDAGVTDIKAEAIRLAGEPTVVAEEKTTGAKTLHYELEVDERTHPMEWERAQSQGSYTKQNGGYADSDYGFFKQKNSGHIVLASAAGTRTDETTGAVITRSHISRPSAELTDIINKTELGTKYEPIDDLEEARKLWIAEREKVPFIRTKTIHIIGGAIIPVWQRLQTKGATNLKVVRVETESGERVVGVLIPNKAIAAVLGALGIKRSFKSPEEIFSAVLDGGEVVNLLHEMKLERTRFKGQWALEIKNVKYNRQSEMRNVGVRHEIINYADRFLIPTDPAVGIPILTKILERYPATGAEGPAIDLSDDDGTAGTSGGGSVTNLPRRGGAPTGLADWFRARRNAITGAFPANYTGLVNTVGKSAAESWDKFKNLFIRNLSRLERTSPEAHTFALRAGGSRGQATVLLSLAANKIDQALKGSGITWPMVRAGLVESRLRGIRERYLQMSLDAFTATDEELVDSLANGMIDVLKHIEGRAGLDDDLAQRAVALMEMDALDHLRDFLGAAFETAADNVGRVNMGPDPNAFERLTNHLAFQSALRLYKELMEGPISESHSINEGIFSDALGPLDTYYPLIAVREQGGILHKLFGGTKYPYRKPKNIANYFATGLAENGYSLEMDDFADRIRTAIKTNNQAALLAALDREGLIQILGRNERAPGIGGSYEIADPHSGEMVGAQLVDTGSDLLVVRPGEGSVRVPGARALIPNWLHKELKPILDKERLEPGMSDAFVNKIIHASLIGPTDLVWHAFNLLGTLVANTPYVNSSLAGRTVGNLPFTKIFTSIVEIARTNPTSEESIKDLIEMANVGLIPPRFGSIASAWLRGGRKFAELTGAKTSFFAGPILYGPMGLDIRARLVLWRVAKVMNPNATPQEMFKFVTQLGVYNRELESGFERFWKGIKVAPFATAGSTMLRNGINAWTGAGPKPVNSAAGKSAYWLAQMLSGGAAGLIALWVLVHKKYRGKYPWEEPGSRLLQIKLNDADRNSKYGKLLFGPDPTKDAFVNLAFFSPITSRGSRAIGVAGAHDTKMLGGTPGQQFEYARRDIYNSFMHPIVSGPIVSGPFIFLTGNEPSLTGLRDITGRFGPQFFPATLKAAPGLPTLARQAEEALLNINPFAKTVAGGFGIGEKGEQMEHRQANWMRMVVDIVAPRLLGSSVDTVKAQQRIGKEAKASTPNTGRGKAGELPDDVRLELHKQQIVPTTQAHKEGESAGDYEKRTAAGNAETADRVRSLVNSDVYKSSNEADRRAALREVIKGSREDATRSLGKNEVEDESGLRVRVKSELDRMMLTMEQHPGFKALPDAQKKTAKVLLDLSFKRYQLSAEERRMDTSERTERAKTKIQMLDEDKQTETLKEYVQRAVERAQRRVAA